MQKQIDPTHWYLVQVGDCKPYIYTGEAVIGMMKHCDSVTVLQKTTQIEGAKYDTTAVDTIHLNPRKRSY